jgi:DNA primase catalytic core
MATSFKDLKNKKYLESTKRFAESLLNIQFLKDSNSAHCPFHDDKSDSFRIYTDGKDDIKFHCFGACEDNWDIYDLIMRKKKCSFQDAQVRFAKFLKIDNIELYKGDKQDLDRQEQEKEREEIEEPVLELDTKGLTDKHREAIQDAAEFYNNLLLTKKDKFEKVFKYLESRGVDEETIKSFTIGFCPSLEDEEYEGRALLRSHLQEFKEDYHYFQYFNKASLFKVLNDQTIKDRNPNVYYYYLRHIDYTIKIYGGFADYFFKRITFPIYNIHSQIEGMVGRRLDKRNPRWLKQTQQDTFIQSKGWLYGIDKSARGIKDYQTVIIVEGIFDFFAFYNISENKERPIVVSTLGSKIEKSSIQLLLELGAKNFIIAFDWDRAGMNGILNAVNEIRGVNISYLGSLKEKEDPADKLKGILSKVSNFGIRHLQEGMKIKSPSGKPIMASFLVQRQKKDKLVQDELLIKPAKILSDKPIEEDPKSFWYEIDDLLILLSYDHKNRAGLNQKLDKIKSLLEDPQKHPPDKQDRDKYYSIPRKFIEDEHYLNIGDALILHLRLAIEQQTRGKKVKETDATIAGWLNTSRKTIFIYKDKLKQAGLLNIKKKGKTQKLSVKYFKTKPSSTEIIRINDNE